MMQSLYALKQSETANYHNALAYFDEFFAPDLNSMEKQDIKQLNQNKKLASSIFQDFFEKDVNRFDEAPADIRKAIDTALDQFNNQLQKDKKHFGKMLEKDLQGIYDNYIYILSLVTELSDYALTPPLKDLKLKDNKISRLLKENKEFVSNTKKGKVVWNNEELKKVYKLSNSEKISKDIEGKDKGLDRDKNLILAILKDIVFKEEFLQANFEEKDINWTENKSIVKNMVLKTIKAVEEKDSEIKLLTLSANWDEDKIFYEELYKKTVDTDKDLEKLISGKIKNWDIERLATLDRIILIMAISEMINFPSIPVKVSINEYIELSKIYSTPKSKQFVNGILDTLSEDLIKRGIIAKSGRGLIDNK
ncbi:MAG: transcription antitermination factor NusB [Cytophagaceae bacterium]|nr:transcription antitermination factor NusB [Cytophagaceae bacterium]